MESNSLPDLSFRDYVLNGNVVFTPTGYFVEAAKSDSEFLAVTSAKELEKYLAIKQLPASSREHARTLWNTYLIAVKRLQEKRDSLFEELSECWSTTGRSPYMRRPRSFRRYAKMLANA